MKNGEYSYKIEQLEKMLESELNDQGSCVHVCCYSRNAHDVLIDADAIRALIENYTSRSEMSIEEDTEFYEEEENATE